MKRRCTAASFKVMMASVVMVASVVLVVGESGASVKSGQYCGAKGKSLSFGGIKYTCVLSGKRLVWKAGATAVQPATAPNVVKVQDTSDCNSNQSDAELQEYSGTKWSDVVPAAGWNEIPGCPAPTNFQPWAIAAVPIGVQVRWHIYAPDNSWTHYTPASTVGSSSCSPPGTTLDAYGAIFTCEKAGFSSVWSIGVERAALPFTIPTLSSFGPPTSCELPYGRPDDFASDGFSDRAHRFPSSGNVKVLLLFVDFPGEPTDPSTLPALFSELTKQSTAYYQADSFGKLTIDYSYFPSVLHIATNPSTYGMTLTQKYNADGTPSGNNEYQYLTDGLNAGLAAGLNYAQYASVVLVPPVADTAIQWGPGFTSNSPLDPNAPTLYNAVALGGLTEFTTQILWVYLSHELSNTMGLEEPWGESNAATATFNNVLWGIESDGGQNTGMDISTIDGVEHLGWNKWLLGWLSDSQVACVDATQGSAPGSSSAIDLTPLETNDGGQKIAVVKLNSHQVIVAEYRTTNGFDVVPPQDAGAFVYLVDTNLDSGAEPSTPAYIPLGAKTDNPNSIVVGTLQTGEQITKDGITVSVIGMNSSNLYLKISGTSTAG